MTGPDREQRPPESDWQRRRRLAEVFGDLPETTSDERDPEERPEDATKRSDTWLEEQVPPHHGS